MLLMKCFQLKKRYFSASVLIVGSVFAGMLHLKELVSTIAAKLQERLLEGTEIYGRKNNRIYPCKIVKVIDEEVEKTQYQVEWLDKDKKVTENAVVSGEDLIKKKLPFGRDVLKAFIKESTCRSSPWVLHDKLALKYGISTILPEELRSKISPKRKLSKEDKVTFFLSEIRVSNFETFVGKRIYLGYIERVK